MPTTKRPVAEYRLNGREYNEFKRLTIKEYREQLSLRIKAAYRFKSLRKIDAALQQLQGISPTRGTFYTYCVLAKHELLHDALTKLQGLYDAAGCTNGGFSSGDVAQVADILLKLHSQHDRESGIAGCD